jgi:hypothetical protein
MRDHCQALEQFRDQLRALDRHHGDDALDVNDLALTPAVKGLR